MTHPEKLTLVAFGEAYPGTAVFDFARVNRILGPTGAGKSQICDALRLVVTGNCPRLTDLKGKPKSGVRIQSPGKDATLSLTLRTGKGQLRITRSIGSGKAVMVERAKADGDFEECVGTVTELQRLIYQETAPESVWRLLFDASLFGRMSKDDRKELLSAVAGGGFSADDVEAEVAKLGPAVLEKWRQLRDPLNFTASYNKVEEWRRDANRTAKNVRVALDAAPKDAAPTAEGVKAAADLVGELTEKVEHAVAARSRTASVNGLKVRLTAINAELRRIAEGRKRSELEEDVETTRTKAKAIKLPPDPRSELSSWEKVAKMMAGGRRLTCPVSRRDCPSIAPDDVQAYISELKRMTENYAARAESLTEAQTAVATAEAALQARIRETARIQELTDEAGGIQADIEAAGGSAPSDADLAALRQQVEDARRRHADLLTRRVQADANDRARKSLAAAEQTAADYDVLLAAYGPEGIKARLSKPSPFAGAVDKAAKLLLGEHWALDAENGVVTVNGRERPVEVLSGGETVCIGVAVQLGIAFATGLGFVAADEFSGNLDPALRNKVLAVLRDNFRALGGGTALLFSQLPDDGKPPTYKSPDISVFVVGDGKITKV